MNNRPVSGKVIWNQLKADLIGKDSYRGVTLSYSWLANQFGHFGLGYMPTLGVYEFLLSHTSCRNPALWAAIYVALAWVLFETYNFLGPLLLNKPSSSKLLFIPSKQTYVFQPAWGNIAFDTVTDLSFFALGAFSASLFLHTYTPVLITILSLIAFLLYPSYYWYTTKIYEQNAVYPFQLRLSQWDLPISDNDRSTVLQFMNPKAMGHLLVFGGKLCGKTSLSVAIANEYSIKDYPCTYATAMKLYLLFFESDQQIMDENKTLWTWRNDFLLIVDDINPGPPVRSHLIDPTEFLQLIDTYQLSNPENRLALREQKVIWVLGDYVGIETDAHQWEEMLLTIGVAKENIHSINLRSQLIGKISQGRI